ncbi:MAG: hypothetical protein ABJB85_07635 [Nitrososphaerota archaeon]
MKDEKVTSDAVRQMRLLRFVGGDSGTTIVSVAAPAFAGGDHDGKKCKNNDDNNCNDNIKLKR